MNNLAKSKSLGHDDSSGFDFAHEMLDGDKTSAINFDRLQYHPSQGYIMFEYLLCEESQFVTPWSSHPNRYWNKNSSKFISLFKASRALNATLYLVNYAKKGTLHENEILVIEMLNIDENDGITQEKVWRTTRNEFKRWFKKLNSECLNGMCDLPKYYIDNSQDEEKMKSLGAHYDHNCGKWYYTDPLDEYKYVGVMNNESVVLANNSTICEVCGTNLTEGVKRYSETHFNGRHLCIRCQGNG